MISVHDGAVAELAGFRQKLYEAFTRRADGLFDLVDAVSSRPERVVSLPRLSLEPEFRRGHGSLYTALAKGRVDVDRMRTALRSRLPGPDARGLVWLAGDVSGLKRPAAVTSPELMIMHDKSSRTVSGRPVAAGWPFAVLTGLEWGPSSWTVPVDAVRLGPEDSLTAVTVASARRVIEDVPEGAVAGFVFDADYDAPALTHELGRQAHVVVRLRCNQRFHARAPERVAGQRGRPRRHGSSIKLNEPGSLGGPDRLAVLWSHRYGWVVISAWDGRHRRLHSEGFWAGWAGELPLVEGSVIQVEVDRVGVGGPAPDRPMWLWHGGPGVLELETVFSAYQRRFDIEHTFRFVKQQLGWAVPSPMLPCSVQVWTWVVLAAYAQLLLARGLCRDARLPWERPVPVQRLTPGRVRRDFRRVRGLVGTPAKPPKSSKAGPGRPVGSTRPSRTRYLTHRKGRKRRTKR